MRAPLALLLSLTLVLTGCAEELHVSDLRGHDLWITAYAGAYNGSGYGVRNLSEPTDWVVFSVSLDGRGVPEASLKATLNGRPMVHHCLGQNCSIESRFQLAVHRDDFGPPENGVLEFSEGDERVVMEVENLFAWRQFSPTPEELGTVHGGQLLDLHWTPETDTLVSDPASDDYPLFGLIEVETQRSLYPIENASFEGNHYRVQLPEQLPQTEAEYLVHARTRPRVLRCEGPTACYAVATAERSLYMKLP